MKATEILKQQHREVSALFKRVQSAESNERMGVLDEIAEKLRVHMQIEETIFYPAVREQGSKKAEELVPEAYEEHAVVKLVLATIPDVDPDDERFQAKMTVLEELIDHHVREEEKEMFKIAEKLGGEALEQLGDEMEIVAEDEEAEADKVDHSATSAALGVSRQRL